MAAALVWWAPSMAWAGGSKVEVCHRKGSSFILLEVPDPALPAHLAHGDYPAVTYYADGDWDGFGDPSSTVVACAAPEGWVANDTDCDDQAAGTFPGAADACGDGIDQDCTGGDPLCSSESGGWLVTAGRIEEGEEPGTIFGTYSFVRLPGGEGDLRGGGACLIADVYAGDPSYECDVDTDCANVPVPPGGFAYCTSPDGSGEPNRCWVRPGATASGRPSAPRVSSSPRATSPHRPPRAIPRPPIARSWYPFLGTLAWAASRYGGW